MVKEKYEVYQKAFKEFREIIKFFPKEEYKKIPKSFIDFIEKNMDNNYEYMVEHVDDFQNQEMLEETRVLLSIVYRDFLASSEEKKQIIKSEKEELLQEERIKQEKYDINTIFEKRNKTSNMLDINDTEISNALVEYKESFLSKIINKIKQLFKRF